MTEKAAEVPTESTVEVGEIPKLLLDISELCGLTSIGLLVVLWRLGLGLEILGSCRGV